MAIGQGLSKFHGFLIILNFKKLELPLNWNSLHNYLCRWEEFLIFYKSQECNTMIQNFIFLFIPISSQNHGNYTAHCV